MSINCRQDTDRVCWGSPISCTSFLDISLLIVTRIKHCISFKTAWPEECQYRHLVWGYNRWGRWRCTLFAPQSGSAYFEIIPKQSSRIHLRKIDGGGHFAHCRLRMWKLSHWANEKAVQNEQAYLYFSVDKKTN